MVTFSSIIALSCSLLAHLSANQYLLEFLPYIASFNSEINCIADLR